MLAITEIEIFSGPSSWSHRPVVHALVDAPQNQLSRSQLRDLQSYLSEEARSSSPDESISAPHDDIIKSIQSGQNVGDVAALLTLLLQKNAGWTVSHAGSQPDHAAGHFHIVCEYEIEAAARSALNVAVDILDELLLGHEPSQTGADVLKRSSLPPSSTSEVRRFVVEAGRRGIPVRQPYPRRSLLEFGSGRYQRRFWGLMTSETPRIGVRIASNKSMTNQLLRQYGLPVPTSALVRSVEQALSAADAMGYPVVLKPLDANHARGVFLDLRSESEIRRHFGKSAAESSSGNVVVERFIVGSSYRILVVNNTVMAVLERVAAHVIGDGTSSIRSIIDRLNEDPRRETKPENVMARIEINDETLDALERQGRSLDDVPDPQQIVWVKRVPKVDTGGSSVDRTDEIHPDNAEVARQATLAVGLDLAGIDFVAPDIARSVWETGGGIAEVNSAPGFWLHTHPVVGKPRNVEAMVLDMLFPLDEPVRVPVIALTGSSDATPAAHLIAHILSAAGHTVGLATPDGIVIGGMPFRRQHPDDPNPTEIVLRNPTIDIAVLALDPADLDHPGLPFDRLDTAVINGAFAFTPQDGLHNIDTILARMVPPTGTTILHADDLLTTDLATDTNGSVLLISPTSGHPALPSHLDSGGRAILFKETAAGPSLVEQSGKPEHLLLTPDQLASPPAAIERNALLVAIAVAIAQNVPAATFASAIRSFHRASVVNTNQR